jgi:tripartite-type tricarboxylate transporter receptor subunit TctC
LNAAVKEIKQSPMVKQQLSTLGAIPIDMTPDELGRLLERELEKWTKVIQAGNIQAN